MGRYLLETVWIVSIQLLIGRWLVSLILGAKLLLRPGRRRSWLRWIAASRSMVTVVYPALGLIVVTAVLHHVIPALGPLSAEPVPLLFVGLRTLVGAGLCAGAWLLIAAGRLEATGRLAPARRLSWTSGRLAAGSAGVWLALELVEVANYWSSQQPSGFDWISLSLVALAGFAALMAALTRKPRPTGVFAAICYGAVLLIRGL